MFQQADEQFEAEGQSGSTGNDAGLSWIEVRPGHPYFFDDRGDTWTPIGQNDAISWPELAGLYRRRDVESVERHLRALKESGVTCLRLMLEYAQGNHRFIERRVGTFTPNMVQLWDDLFALCERIGLRILLTPFDTFFTWVRWKHHPYNVANGGPCSDRSALLSCPDTRRAIKARLEFATRRWGASPALFAWDIWNEMHPAHAGGNVDTLAGFVDEVAPWLKALELGLHGRRHPLTVSVFGPELVTSPAIAEVIFRHPELDFANIHLYERGTIDKPRNTIAPAIATGRLMQSALGEIRDERPLFDSEHGPIHAFLDRKTTLPEPFDDEYFRHIQWAHIASGGAGGGMRWPNRNPHVLTPGMRAAQASLSKFLPLVDWTRFKRRCLDGDIQFSRQGLAGFGCGDERQILLWLLRTDACRRDGMINPAAKPVDVTVVCPAENGRYRVQLFDTRKGMIIGEQEASASFGRAAVAIRDFTADLALVLTRL
jgi:hypothetical protein